ncbi:MAG: HD family hydrolase [Candidatus Hadarchaeales archaeon]
MIELLKKINQLKEIPRTGWLLAGVSLAEVEDVSQHSFEVASIVMLLGKKIGRKVNVEKAVKMALIHDMPECLVGDFPYPGLKYLSRRNKKEMETRAAEELFGEEKELLELWKEFVEERSIEAELVHAADYLSILLQALRYAECGNLSDGMLELWNQVLLDLDPYAKKFPEIGDLIENLKSNFNRLCNR